MMLGLHGRPAEVDVFKFYLATQLGKTVEEVDGMAYSEYVQWAAYYTAKHAIEHKKATDGSA